MTPSIVDADGLTGVTINADGTLTVPANTPAGTYDVEYQICEVANPTNCDTAIATVVVAPVIDAMDDDFTSMPIPAAGGSTPTVFSDDTLNGAPFAPADVTPSIVDADGLTGVTINPDAVSYTHLTLPTTPYV